MFVGPSAVVTPYCGGIAPIPRLAGTKISREGSTALAKQAVKSPDRIVDMPRDAQEEAFRYAKAVSADKLEWKPLDADRTVLDLAREFAQ